MERTFANLDMSAARAAREANSMRAFDPDRELDGYRAEVEEAYRMELTDNARRAAQGTAGRSMTHEEYEAKRREIIERYNEEIWEHEDAGCYGDADNARRWMRVRLDELKNDYEEGR